MKKGLIFLCLFTPFLLMARPEYPGDAIWIVSELGAEAALPIDGDSPGGALTLGLKGESLFADTFIALNGRLQWLPAEGLPMLVPEGQLRAGYSFHLWDSLVIEPFGGVGVLMAIPSSDDALKLTLETGAEMAFHLNKRRYLNLRASFRYPFHPDLKPQVLLGVSLSAHRPVFLPAPVLDYDLEISPDYFSPDGDGENDTLFIDLNVKEENSLSRWEIDIIDPEGQLFHQLKGLEQPMEPVTWNGRAESGEWISSALDYTLKIRLWDILGNPVELERTLHTDILIIKEGDNLKIRIPSIQFPAGSGDFALLTDREMIESNRVILTRLSDIFNRFPSYQITIEGHANHLMQGETERRLEQERILIPLSLKRAEAVKNALVELGIEADRIDTIGLGGSIPLFDGEDEANLWKNRRVEFLLVR